MSTIISSYLALGVPLEVDVGYGRGEEEPPFLLSPHHPYLLIKESILFQKHCRKKKSIIFAFSFNTHLLC